MDIKLGSKWVGNEHTFIVTDCKQDDNGMWVYYVNPKTDQSYHCLVEAFVQRFRQHINQ